MMLSRVSTLLQDDHRRLLELWDECQKAAQTLDALKLAHLRNCFGKFAAGLRRHIQAEEKILFPRLEKRRIDTALTADPLAIVRSEHREIEQILDNLEELTRAREYSTVVHTLEGQPYDFAQLLASHISKEQEVLYPLIDRLLGEEETQKLAEAVRTELGSSEQTVTA